ncbi:MAG: hypothetical protein ABII13_05340 [Patescibacteria group bacterium]|nr:hypothetical protein [Patescibacteria group bacterium]MBU2508791.1 hypothetical protein [Patescibacteria group bacterium]
MKHSISSKQPNDLDGKQKKIKKFRIFLGIVLAIFFVAYLIYSSPRVDTAIKDSYLSIFIISFVCVGICIILVQLLTFILKTITKFFKFIFRHPIFVAGFFLILIAAVASVFILFELTHRTEIATSVIQDNLTELISIKIKANAFPVSKKMNADWEEAASSTKIIFDNLSSIKTPDTLNDYQLASLAWSKEILESANTANWKKINDQPGDFKLSISDDKATNFLTLSIKKIEELKEQGNVAITNKDRDAMRKIAASLLVQIHWLNGVLHSSTDSLSINIINTAYAQDNLLKLPGVPEVGPGCAIETNPKSDNYGKCKVPGTVQTPEENKKTAPVKPGEKTKLVPEKDTDQKENVPPGADLETYTPHVYSSDIRKVCFTAYNGKDFCVPEVIEATTNIYKTAINYANGKVSGISSWDKAWESATNLAGIEPSIPSAEGGHEIPSEGVVSHGAKDTPPPPSPKVNTPMTAPTPVPAPTPVVPKVIEKITWDGNYFNVNGSYSWSTISCVGNTGREDKQSKGGLSLRSVTNNMVNAGSGQEKAIDSNGYVSYETKTDSEYSTVTTWQFYRKDGIAYADGKDVERYVGTLFGNPEQMTCTRTATVYRVGD